MSMLALVWTATDTVDRLCFAGKRLEIDTPGGPVFVSPALSGWEGFGWRLAEIAPFVVPEGKRRVGAPSYALDGDVVVETYEVEDTPPPSPADHPLVNWRFHWMISQLGWDATIRATIDALPDPQARSIVLFRYEKSSEYNRDDAALNAIAAAMNLSAEDLDAAWMTAATVGV